MTDPAFRMITDFLLLSVVMAAVIGGLLVFRKLLGKKFSARSQYIIWAIVMLRLAVPFSAHDLALFRLNLPERAEVTAAEETAAEQEVIPDTVPEETAGRNEDLQVYEEPVPPDEIVYEEDTPLVSTTIVPDEILYDTPAIPSEEVSEVLPEVQPEPGAAETEIPGDSEDEAPGNALPGGTILLTSAVTVWLSISAVLFAVPVVQAAAYVRRLKRTCRTPDDETLAVYEKLCRKYKIRRAPELAVSPAVGSPMLCGYFKSRIILPDIALDENQTVGILAHELTHYKRGDLWWKLVSLIGRSLHWFNPMAYAANRAFSAAMELSCDERVLDGMSDAARLSYGEVMLDIIKRCSRRDLALTTQFNPRTSAVRERFTNIVDSTKKKKGVVIIALAALLCLFAGILFACEQKADLPENAILLKAETFKWEMPEAYCTLEDGTIAAADSFFREEDGKILRYRYSYAVEERYADEIDVTAHVNHDGTVTIRSKTDRRDAALYTEVTRTASFAVESEQYGVLTVTDTSYRDVHLDSNGTAGEWVYNNQTIGAYQIFHLSGPDGEYYVYGDKSKPMGLNDSVLKEMQPLSFSVTGENDFEVCRSEDGRYLLVLTRTVREDESDCENRQGMIVDLTDGTIRGTMHVTAEEILAAAYGKDVADGVLEEYASDGYNPVRYRILWGKESDAGELTFADGVFSVPVVLETDDGAVLIKGRMDYTIVSHTPSGFIMNSFDGADEAKTAVSMQPVTYTLEEAREVYGLLLQDIEIGEVYSDSDVFAMTGDDEVTVYAWREPLLRWHEEQGESDVRLTGWESGSRFRAESVRDRQPDGSYIRMRRIFIRSGDNLYLVQEEKEAVNLNRTYDTGMRHWTLEYNMADELLYLRGSNDEEIRFGDFSAVRPDGLVPEHGPHDNGLLFAVTGGDNDFTIIFDESSVNYAALAYHNKYDYSLMHAVVIDLTGGQIIAHFQPQTGEILDAELYADSMSTEKLDEAFDAFYADGQAYEITVVPESVENGGFRFNVTLATADGKFSVGAYRLYDTVTKQFSDFYPTDLRIEPAGMTDAEEKMSAQVRELFDNGSLEGYYTPAAIYGETMDVYVLRTYDEANNTYKTTVYPSASDGTAYIVMGRLNERGGFMDYMTYEIVSENGAVTAASKVETVQPDHVKEYGKPIDSITPGEYISKHYNIESGQLVCTELTFGENSSVTVSVGYDNSSVDRGLFTGSYDYHAEDGRIVFDLRTSVDGSACSVSGTLLKYGGYAYFFCESSDLGKLISPDDPHPMVFAIREGEIIGQDRYVFLHSLEPMDDEVIAVFGDLAVGEVVQEYNEETGYYEIVVYATGTDGNVYVVLRKPDGNGEYTSAEVFHIAANGGIVIVYEMTNDVTAENIVSKGTLLTTPPAGTYTTEFMGQSGWMYLSMTFIPDEDSAARLSVSLAGTDGGIYTEGSYAFDEETGEITLSLTQGTDAVYAVRGKMYSYGFVQAFVCEESSISALPVTEGDDLPYLFSPYPTLDKTSSVQNSEHWALEQYAGGTIYALRMEKDDNVRVHWFQCTDPSGDNYLPYKPRSNFFAATSTDESFAVLFYWVQDDDTGPYRMNAAAVDLTNGKIQYIYDPDPEALIASIDVSGSIREKFDLENYRLSLYAEIPNAPDSVTIMANLMSGKQLLEGSVGLAHADYQIDKASAGRVITGNEEDMVLTDELMLLHDKACEAVYWFEGLDQLQGDWNTTITRESGRGGRLEYAKVTDPVFEENGINSLETLENYFRTIFTEEMTASLMKFCTGDEPILLEADGAMWILGAARGSNFSYSRPEYFLSESTENTAVITARVYRWTDITEDGYLYEDEPTDFQYRFELAADGTWRCASFEGIW